MGVLKLLLLLSLLSAPLVPADRDGDLGTLVLRVDNIAAERGTLWVGIYESPADFLDREKARLVYHKVTGTGREEVPIPGLVVGKTYAIAVFQDENDNGELDTNLLGLPAEPWATSRPLRSWFRKPRFEEMSFVFRPEQGLPPLILH